MGVTLWIDTDRDEAMELGGTLPTYAAFAEIARAVDGWPDERPALAGVLTQCELQEDADPTWLEKVRAEAKAVLQDHGDSLSEDARNLLENLSQAQPD